MVYSTRLFVVCLTLCHFVLVFFNPFSNAITSLGEERANLSAFRTFDRFVLVWICRFPLPLGVWEGLRFVIVALPGLFSYLLLMESSLHRLVNLMEGDYYAYVEKIKYNMSRIDIFITFVTLHSNVPFVALHSILHIIQVNVQ